MDDATNKPQPGGQSTEAGQIRSLVWDLPTRLFHWTLAILVLTSILTGLNGSFQAMKYHIWSGTAILALVIYRILWGIVGGRYARFTDFVKGPVHVARYAVQAFKGTETPTVGHNPMGGWSILVILGLLGYQAVTGLMSNDDIFTEGPWAKLVGKDQSDAFTSDHLFNVNLIYVLIALHLTAVFFHSMKGENLLAPMINGKKDLVTPTAPDAKGHPGVALALLLLSAGAVYYAAFVYP